MGRRNARTAVSRCGARPRAGGGTRGLLDPWIRVIDQLTPAAGSGLAREVAAGLHQLGRLAEAGPVAERAVRLAEASGNPELTVLALNVFANGCDDGGLPRIASAVYRSAADLARTNHLLVPLNTVLGNLAAVELNQDPPAGIRACREAVELATRIGHTHSVVGAAGNMAEMLRGTGQWDELVALQQLPTVEDAVAAGVLEVEAIMTNVALVALARGDRSDVPRLATHGLDEAVRDGYESVLVPFRDAVAAAFDDVRAASESAGAALRLTYERHGVAAYFPIVWPAAVDWAIEAGQLAQARDRLALVTEVHRARATPVLRAQAMRLQAFVDAADPSGDPDGVETRLTDAIAALVAIGYQPDAARTQAVFARWLAGRGREDDAREHREQAAATFGQLGATAWSGAPVG